LNAPIELIGNRLDGTRATIGHPGSPLREYPSIVRPRFTVNWRIRVCESTRKLSVRATRHTRS
jgi:hypothetical protein